MEKIYRLRKQNDYCTLNPVSQAIEVAPERYGKPNPWMAVDATGL
jgi:hypothetical protein